MTRPRGPRFKNDNGLPTIRVGSRAFLCAGASAPHDHPHIYLEMGAGDSIRCPYCGTEFRYDPRLGPGEVFPSDCLFSRS